MTYDNLYNEFLNRFPEDRAYFNMLCYQNGIEKDSDQPIYFAMVVVPYIDICIKKDVEKCRRVFDFVEEMSNDVDLSIREMVEYTILPEIYALGSEAAGKCRELMGEETGKLFDKVAKMFI